MSPLAFGVDVGLSGVRACVVDADGAVIATGRKSQPIKRRGPLAEHDPDQWISGLIEAGREALAGVDRRDVRAIGVSALGPAPVLVDRQLHPLTTAPLFSLDRRAEAERRELADGLPHDLRAETFDSALPKLIWWLRNDPEACRRAAWALDATGFIVAQLTGTPSIDAITVGDFRLPGHECPFPLPDPVEALAPAGELRGPLADALGLTEGIPVATGTYDTYVDFWAAGVRRPGDACCSIGSTLIVCQVAAHLVAPDGLVASRYPGEGLLVGGWTLSTGAALDWASGRFAGGREAAELSEVAATLEPGDGGLLAIPYLAGERTPVWDLDARGALIGLSPETTEVQMYRAFVDAVALSALDHTDRLAAAIPRPARWLATGGGTSNNAVLQAISDAIGSPLDVIAGADRAAGPARLALYLLGIDAKPEVTRSVDPDASRHAIFQELLRHYRRLYSQIADTTHALSNRQTKQSEGDR